MMKPSLSVSDLSVYVANREIKEAIRMSAGFEHLKKVLEEKGTLSPEEVAAVEKEHGPLTDEEKFWLESEMHKKDHAERQSVTMDEYLAASKVLDSAEEGSDEYKKALEIVEKFEAGM